MKMFIVGQKWLGAEVLKAAIRMGHNVAGVCAPMHGDASLRRDKLYETATEAGIPVLASYNPQSLPARLMPDDLDLILAAHATWYITPEVVNRARYGVIGYHPSLLPRHRGRDAIRWAIAMRDGITGGTVYRFDAGADTGPIVAQDWCFIRPGDTPAELWRRDLAPMGVSLFGMVLADPDHFLAHAKPQDESLATWEPSFTRPRLSAARDKCQENDST